MKHILLLVFLIFNSFTVFAQSLKELNDSIVQYYNNGEIEKGIIVGKKAVIVAKKQFGENHTEYAKSLNNLAELYRNIYLYQKAQPLYIQAIEIMKNVLGENHPSFAIAINNLALLYKEMGQYEKAETLFIQAKEILKNSLGESSPDYATAINNLAMLYKEMGQYEKAEPLFVQSMQIRKKTLGENHHDYASGINNLAELYVDMGQYEKAESLFIQAMEIDKKTLGEDHPDYATVLNNLAYLYQKMRLYEKAETLFMQAMEIDKKVLGEEHPDYATDLNNLAMLYEEMGQYEKAEPLFVQTKEIRKKIFGETHPKYATVLNNLAGLYESMDQYKKAESLFIQTMEIDKKVLGEEHPDYATDLNNLALLYQRIGQYAKAESLILLINQINVKNLENTFTVLSEKEKSNYLRNNMLITENNNSFLYNYRKASASTFRDNFNLQLFFKSLSLAETRNMLETAGNSRDSTIKNLFNEWRESKKFLSKQYSQPLSDRMPDLTGVETQTENLEKELNRKSSAFRNQQNDIRISMNDVQKKLQQDEVAIEFVSFNLYNKKWTDSIIYAAYVLHKNDSVPQFVPLCEEKQLGKYFSPSGGAATIKAIYRSEVVDEDEKTSISGDSLYALVWKPLLPYLQGIKKINYSPAGLLYKIAFHALPAGDSLLLMDKYDLNQYISVRQLALQQEKNTTAKSIALFGDCQFTMDSTVIVNSIPANEKANTFITANLSRSGNTGGWKQLSGTEEEIKNIQTLFDKNKISSASFSQANATEEQFKSLSGNSPSIIHLATHGFFLPDPEMKRQEGFAADERNAFTLADDPLLRSGIVLSGANRVWSGKKPIEGREDGIVTAYEIAQMDLSKTDLVVLSACETALGDIKGNEGVFGLQRAFKLAGVKNMLLSLWKVPDAETAELMKVFYTYYLQGKTARDAFSSAQKDMRKKYKPYYWAAFVLIE